ncbi:glycosyltransferase family 9 protein [Gelidibacter salicanalis]|uniref:Glycosyltransferase family 9 protein n=1 Tax=Gelidibacter salicanalis TaxID=291193 RepID=A0A5C7AUR5_9FLAO|nr:glycosyltransferase family 9 protein [Gelidibacter salicanalis]TXE09502.1 glycosyltransferase family 9 protein [Gelidibacter salicanalis]
MKILIIQQKMIGDVLTSSMLFEALKAQHPNAELHYLINTHTFSVVEHNPFIDTIVFFTKEHESSKLALLKLAKSIRREHYDVVIDVYSKLSSNIISLFSGAKTKISYYKSYTSALYTHNIKRKPTATSTDGLAVEHRLQLLEPLEIHQTNATPKIYLTNQEIANSASILERNGIHLDQPLYMISVLGSGVNKTYPFKYMAKVIDSVIKTTKGQVLFNYIPNQATEARAIYELCKPEHQKNIHFDVFAKDLRGFLAITSHCDALIGNEGGAINMAKALGIKTFAIFSPWIDTETWGAVENSNHVNVHLKTYAPALYAGKADKEMKREALSLYKSFKPSYFIEKLQIFLNQTLADRPKLNI